MSAAHPLDACLQNSRWTRTSPSCGMRGTLGRGLPERSSATCLTCLDISDSIVCIWAPSRQSAFPLPFHLFQTKPFLCMCHYCMCSIPLFCSCRSLGRLAQAPLPFVHTPFSHNPPSDTSDNRILCIG